MRRRNGSATSRLSILLDWKGEDLKRKIETAQRQAIDATMAGCIVEAKERVPVRTATLQGSIRMEPARPVGDMVVGRWGSFEVNYALWVEIGTARMSGTPYLRPAADHQYPLLAGYLRAAFKAAR